MYYVMNDNGSIENNTSQKMTKQFSIGGILTAATPQITISPAMLTPLWRSQEVPNLKKHHKRIGGSGRCVLLFCQISINVVCSCSLGIWLTIFPLL